MLSVFFFPDYFVNVILWQFWTPSCPCWQENTVLSLVFCGSEVAEHSVFVLVVRRLSRTVGREKAWLPLRRCLAATAELDQVRALRVADW